MLEFAGTLSTVWIVPLVANGFIQCAFIMGFYQVFFFSVVVVPLSPRP